MRHFELQKYAYFESTFKQFIFRQDPIQKIISITEAFIVTTGGLC